MTHTESTDHVAASARPSPHQAWNTGALVVDTVLFGVGMAFISPTVVLPSFVAALTDSEVIVGLAAGLTSAGWLLPQLVVASATARLTKKKPVIVRAAWTSRLLLLLVALAIWLFGQQLPALTLVVGLAGVFVFFALDGVVSVLWFDVLAKVLPHTRRGRILGTSQFVGGLGAIGAGMAVRFILSKEGPWAFPNNYALLFALASIPFLVGAVCLSAIREPESRLPDKGVPSTRKVLSLLPGMLVRDRPFLRLVAVRLLGGCISVASAFYVLYATRNLGLSTDAVGLFVSAQVVGSLTAGLLMTVIQDRWGPLIHIRTLRVLSAIPPVIALCVGRMPGVLGQHVLYPYMLTYFFLGLSMGSGFWPYVNWIIEYANEVQRPLYIGALNTLGALSLLAPLLGGWVARSISYPAVFGLALVFSVSSLLASFALPDTRRRPSG